MKITNSHPPCNVRSTGLTRRVRGLSNLAIYLVLVTVLVGFPSGCSHRSSDEAIAKDIQGKISSDPDTKDSQVSVVAKDGKVQLSGHVKSPADQQKIEQIAREEPGASR